MNSQSLIRVIAMREFMSRIRTRVFVITTVLTIAGIAAYILLQAYVFNKSAASLDVGFVGAAQSISAPVRAEAASYGETIDVHPYASLAAVRAAGSTRWSADPEPARWWLCNRRSIQPWRRCSTIRRARRY